MEKFEDMTIGELIAAICRMPVISDESGASTVEFTQALATIQNRLGQDDGGFAAMHMSGYIHEKWSTMTLPERAEFWKDYVRKEVSFLYIGEEFEE